MSTLIPDGPRRSPARNRPSLGLKQSLPQLNPPSNSRVNSGDPSLRRIVSASSMKASSKLTISTNHNRPEILSPTPRRHLLDSSVSPQWLHTPPLSPMSSRGTSPVSTFSTSSSVIVPRRQIVHHKSFSSLLEHEESPKSPSVGSGVRPRHDSISSSKAGSVAKVQTQPDGDGSMGRRWVKWLHKRGIKQWAIPGIIAASTLVKLCMSMGSYSGRGTPPMYGDYEAQRHWMELTLHLPFRQWYTYDLQYWGLDYPPLTAYISWICGVVASWINPSWVALDTSRGIETETSKLFMRLTVVFWDALVYVPATIFFTRTWQGTRSTKTQTVALLTLLLQPALLLIDFGHFQYNSVMLGFTLLSINFFAAGQDLLGAVCFVLSLGFKQMALYYAPAIGSYLLAKCIYLGPTHGTKLFVRLAMTTLSTFILLFLPWLPPLSPISAILDPITRIFPFARGLFEDKVANFWCASNVIIKWKVWASSGALVKLSAALTALGFTPGVFGLLQSGVKFRLADDNTKKQAPRQHGEREKAHPPFLSLLPYALLTSSMSFFLFSFQVHEKTILVPLLPITLLLSGATIDSPVYSWGALVNNAAVFSMWPLLKRDGLGAQYIAALLLWNRLIGYNPFGHSRQSFIGLLSIGFYVAAVSIHVLEVLFNPPARYPDLFPVLNVLVSTPVFVLTWLWSIKCGVEVSWALGGPGPIASGSSGHSSTPAPGSPVARRTKTISISEGQRRPSESEGSSTGVAAGEGYRQMGVRAMSLGFAQGRRKSSLKFVDTAGAGDGQTRSRRASIGPVGPENGQ
ncbi:hypothetical protein AX16_008045 [Volvariella volvacea WC 439]|nr:hypothetical protein AX16_008045 [Volvariella volvacea WC 439]